MTRTTFRQLALSAARRAGWSTTTAVAWLSRGDLVASFQLQNSGMSGGVYFNTGLLPRPMITRASPPGAGYWCLGERAGRIDGPWRAWFVERTESVECVQPEEVNAAATWLCRHIAEHMLSRSFVEAFYQELPDDGRPDILRDWLRGRLRPPQEYWPRAPYYR